MDHEPEKSPIFPRHVQLCRNALQLARDQIDVSRRWISAGRIIVLLKNEFAGFGVVRDIVNDAISFVGGIFRLQQELV